MSEQTRQIDTYIGEDGNPTAHVTMSPTSNLMRCHVEAPPDRAIPIVFLPGIMGSPLIATGNSARLIGDENVWAWFPDDSLGWVAGITKWSSYSSLSPAQRKRLLNPHETRPLEVTDQAHRKTVEKAVQSSIPVEEAFRRGWGTVLLDSYGEILKFLETRLSNIITPRGEPSSGTAGRAIPSRALPWGEYQGTYTPLDKQAFQAAAEFRYPVFAVGYNWLRSNEDAAEYLYDRTQAILSYCKKDLRLTCNHGVILLTHSMGGLVARRFAQQHPEMVQGIVHSVQPSVGAATAYRRVRAGWEDFKGAVGLGDNGKKIMPIFANAAGPLELLPTQSYGTGWLRAQSNSGEPIFQLPLVNPYDEIYLETRAWWRLMDPLWVDPVDTDAPPGTPRPSIARGWENYSSNIELARKFHGELGNYYHPNTYVTYGGDDGKKAFSTVTWRFSQNTISSAIPGRAATAGPMLSKAHALDLHLKFDNYKGRVTMINSQSEKAMINQYGAGVVHDTLNDAHMADLQDADQAGDSTVPLNSAKHAADNARFAVKMKGYGHQDSFKDERVKEVTLYALLRIGSTAQKLSF
ncbi:lipase family alpha/beta hydrolase [Achromobacter sp. NPDC058515]|uniref:lipase family alpha/beta hydrolase n=1 Tax=Achromobacter sp. NPDC058515 TaxID=3346533 RepID=UPI00365D4A5F